MAGRHLNGIIAVWDWCANPWRAEGPPDPSRIDLREQPSPDDLIVCRGGAWTSSETTCRSASRGAARADVRTTTLGFRLVRSVPP